MEVNAAAAMAKFKSFRAPPVVKEPEKEVPLVASPTEPDASETVVMDPTTEAAVAEACAGNQRSYAKNRHLVESILYILESTTLEC